MDTKICGLFCNENKTQIPLIEFFGGNYIASEACEE